MVITHVTGCGSWLPGASGYIGRAVVEELKNRGHQVVALVRESSRPDHSQVEAVFRGVHRVPASFAGAVKLSQDLAGIQADAVILCLAYRTGVAQDAWAIDNQANKDLLEIAQSQLGISQFILLSAICVQKPKLAFQAAKLAFEKALQESQIDYAIVRPTAFFKSLSGQIERVKDGKSYLVFGDGELTACKPISREDLARFMVDCLENSQLKNRILPVGGPGNPWTPRAQGELLFQLLGQKPKFKRVSPKIFDIALSVLHPLSIVSARMAEKAELARIGRYYATESMLLWDQDLGRYDASATPSYGEQHLEDFFKDALKNGLEGHALGKQKLF